MKITKEELRVIYVCMDVAKSLYAAPETIKALGLEKTSNVIKAIDFVKEVLQAEEELEESKTRQKDKKEYVM